jgi:ribosomal protein S18 acetylase RimI-like enzyme
MTHIRPALPGDSELLANIGKTTFIEAHGHSASPTDIAKYVAEKYREEVVAQELADPTNCYHIISHNDKPAGYSKIIMNSCHRQIPFENVTKLERLYLLSDFYDLKLGCELLQFNIDLSHRQQQSGMWLYVWKENQRAIRFYTKAGFRIIGSHNFQISDRHSNPNHQMLLTY